MNRFTQQNQFQKVSFRFLFQLLSFFAVFFLFLLPVSSISATTKQEEIENLKQVLSAVPFTVMPWKELIRKVFLILENHYWNLLMIIQISYKL